MNTLSTDRLLLTLWNPAHQQDFYELMRQPSCIDGGWKPLQTARECAEAFPAYCQAEGVLAITLKESGKVIGFVKLYPDANRGRLIAMTVNYLLHESYWHHGYMTEALGRAIRYAFETLNIDLLSAFTTPQNMRSQCVIARCGLTRECVIEQGYERFDGQRFDAVVYAITSDEYRAQYL